MKFGRRLEAEQEEAYRPYYLRYNELKVLLKTAAEATATERSEARDDARHIRAAINRRLTPSPADSVEAGSRGGGEGDDCGTRFMSILEADLERAGKFVALQVEDIQLRARALAARAAAASAPAELDRIEAAADEVAATAVRLDRFVLLSYAGFAKIVKKHDKVTGLCTRPWLLTRLGRGEFMRARFDRVVTSLSDAFAAVRARRAGGAPEGGGAWVPPSDFERATTKYWVAPEDVLAVKLALVKHLPVLIFGRPAALDAAQDVPSDSSLISSVYLDSAKLDVYRSRLERDEGATLVRVRWYGDVAGDASGDAELFVERKTHHESWTTDRSVKERFRLKGRHVAALLRGQLDVEAQLAKLQAGGASEADVARTRTLATEVADEVARRRLQPALRTVYFRTAFQLSSSNAVRVSLDTQLRMVDERDAPRSSPDAWCRRLDADTPLAGRECVDFPFAVLEVKLQDAAPDWVEELLASGRLIQCAKFSKFLHGTASLRTHEVPKLPHWWDDAAVALPAQPAVVPIPITAAAVALLPAQVGRSLSGARAFSQCSMGVAENGSTDDLPALRPRAGGQLLRTMSAPPVASLETVVAMPEQRLAAPLRRRSSFAAVKERVSGALGGGSGGASAPGGAPLSPTAILTAPAKRHVPIKVEPKTFFANERTMLQWLNMATLILFTSLALTSYNDPVARNKVAADGTLDYSSQVAGAVLAPVSIVFIIYALYTYLWRAQRIAAREPSARFDDRWGPAVLVVLLLTVTTTSVALTIAHADWHKHGTLPPPPAPPAAVVKPSSLLVLRGTELALATHARATSSLGVLDAASAREGRACGQLRVAWPPFFRPRGAALAAAGDALLLGGAFQLLRVPLPSYDTGNSSDISVLPAPGWDCVSLARGPDAGQLTLLAAAGSRPGAAFAAFDEASGAVTPAAGALSAAAGGADVTAVGAGADGTLLVASAGCGLEVLQRRNASAGGGLEATWQAVRRFPADALSADLADGHVAALSYDAASHTLLLLFDRAAPPLLRALQLRSGEVLQDWVLPAGEGAWSGLALTADGAAAYLTRAAPPQLWRFARRADGAIDCQAQG